MKKLKNSLPLLLVLVLSISAMASLSPVASSPGTIVSVEPPVLVSTTAYPPGTAFSVDVNITSVSNLFGYEFMLVYDKTIITALWPIKLGNVFPSTTGPPPNGPTIIWKNVVDDNVGYVWYAVSLGRYQTPFTGSGRLATINFKVDLGAWGGSLLDLANTVLSDSYGYEITHEVHDGLFSNIRDPPTAMLDIEPTTAPELGEKLYFDASGSHANPPVGEVGSIVRYDWDFGDGTNNTDSRDHVGKPTPYVDHTYTALGTYTAVVTVHDDVNAKGKTEVDITVSAPTTAKADLAEWKAMSDHKTHDISRYGTVNTFYALVQNLGNFSTTITVKVKFIVSDALGTEIRTVWTNEYEFPPYTYLRDTDYWLFSYELHGLNTTSTGEFDVTGLKGRYYATAQAYYKIGSSHTWVAGTLTKTFSFTVKP